jgi:hypothetical protein
MLMVGSGIVVTVDFAVVVAAVVDLSDDDAHGYYDFEHGPMNGSDDCAQHLLPDSIQHELVVSAAAAVGAAEIGCFA